MKTSAPYAKVVERSEDDNCYVGSCPGLFYGGCHGEDEGPVFAELCRVVEETIELHTEVGKPLPSPTAARTMQTECWKLPERG